MSAVQAHPDYGGCCQHLSRRVRAQAADRLEPDLEKTAGVWQRDGLPDRLTTGASADGDQLSLISSHALDIDTRTTYSLWRSFSVEDPRLGLIQIKPATSGPASATATAPQLQSPADRGSNDAPRLSTYLVLASFTLMPRAFATPSP